MTLTCRHCGTLCSGNCYARHRLVYTCHNTHCLAHPPTAPHHQSRADLEWEWPADALPAPSAAPAPAAAGPSTQAPSAPPATTGATTTTTTTAPAYPANLVLGYRLEWHVVHGQLVQIAIPTLFACVPAGQQGLQ